MTVPCVSVSKLFGGGMASISLEIIGVIHGSRALWIPPCAQLWACCELWVGCPCGQGPQGA